MTNDNNRARNKRTPRRGSRSGPGASSNGARSRKSDPAARGRNRSADLKAQFERYVAMAKNAAMQGDAVESEGFYQHAEHFLRLMKEQTA